LAAAARETALSRLPLNLLVRSGSSVSASSLRDCASAAPTLPSLTPQALADLGVAEVREVAQEHEQAAARRQLAQRLRQLGIAFGLGQAWSTSGVLPLRDSRRVERFPCSALLRAIRQIHASSDPPRKSARRASAVAEASCTASRADSWLPLTVASAAQKPRQRSR
jgi:hypothetical protein